MEYLCGVGGDELLLSFLEGGDEACDEVEDVVERLGVDLGAHFHEALDDGLEEGEGGLLGVLLEDVLDALEVLLGLDEVHLGLLADLHQGSALGPEVHEQPLRLLAGLDGVVVVGVLRGEVGVLTIQSVHRVVLGPSVALQRGRV